MLRNKRVLLISLILITVAILSVLLYLSRPIDTSSGDSSIKTIDNLDEALSSSVIDGLERYDFDCGDCQVSIGDYEEYDKWVIASIVLTNLPEGDESRNMAYVFEKNGNELTLIAFTGDSFSANSFPEGTDQKIIDKVTE